MRSTPKPLLEVTFDLSQRLSNEQLSLAWAYLSQEDPMSPIPSELSHLTEPEWSLAHQLLQQNLWLREHLPLQ